jgi:hypothetical protein
LAGNQQFFPTGQGDAFRRFGRVRLQLVDDQYKLGYNAILAQLLFGAHNSSDESGTLYSWTGDDRRLSITSASDPRRLLVLLQEALKAEPDWMLPRNVGAGEFDILLLDLRLFSDSKIESASATEKSFLRDLIDFAEAFKYGEIGDGALNAAVSAARARVDGGREDLRALTLLPLLLSHADPSLPIILFSSTRQREVVETCRHRSNIITSFSKPIVTGYNVEGASLRGVDNLVSALKTALTLHKIRIVWMELQSLCTCIKGGVTNVEEPLHLTPKGSPPLRYKLSLDFVRVMTAEYQRLLARGCYADALLPPHNLIEDAGVAEIKNPVDKIGKLQHLDLAKLRPTGQEWLTFLHQRADDETNRLLKSALDVLKIKEPTTADDQAFDGSLKAFKERLRSANLPTTIAKFRTDRPDDANRIQSHTRMATLEAVIELAMNTAVTKDIERVAAASEAGNMAAVAAYQYYVVIAAARNGRSHYHLRPLEHDAAIEDFACRIWLLLLAGSRLLLEGRRPFIAIGATEPARMYFAKCQNWLPTSGGSLLDFNGPDFARTLFTRLGHLLKLGMFQCAPEFADLADYAMSLATTDAGAADAWVAPPLPSPVLPVGALPPATPIQQGTVGRLPQTQTSAQLGPTQKSPNSAANSRATPAGQQRADSSRATHQPFSGLGELWSERNKSDP